MTLLEIPVHPMREILEKCDLLGIQCLRKTCRDLRNFIDDAKLNPKITNIYISFEVDQVSLTIYRTIDELHLTWENNRYDFIESFCQDFEIITRNQSSKMEFFQILIFPDAEISEKFEKILKIRNFKTEKLSIRAANSTQIMMILKCFSLKKLEISDSRKTDSDLELGEIVELDQWKNLEDLVILDFTVRLAKRFLHLETCYVNVMTLSLDELLMVKETCLKSPKSLKFNYIYLDSYHDLYSTFGPHCYVSNELFHFPRYRWFYRIPNNEQYVLCIEPASKCLSFTRELASDVPWELWEMASELTLIELPEVSINKILEYVDFCDILSLQKTCRALRDFIPDTKPQIDQIEISGTPQSISLVLYYWKPYPEGQQIRLSYQEKGRITWFRSDGIREKKLENSDFLELFSWDLSKIFGDRLVSNFFLKLPMDTVVLEALVKSFDKKLKVETFATVILNQSAIKKVLTMLCPKTLKSMEIAGVKGNYTPCSIDNLMELEQWKGLRELNIKGFPVLAGIQKFEHFVIAKIWLEEVTMEDLRFLKKKFFSSYSEHFQLFYTNAPDENSIFLEFGQPFIDEKQFYMARQKTWFYEKDEEVVLIGNFDNFFVFNLIKKEKVPKGAVIKTVPIRAVFVEPENYINKIY